MNIKAIALAFTLLVLTPFATAQCPVQVTKIRNYELNTMFVEYENTSDKDIHAVKFSAVFLDAVGDPHSAVYDYTSERKLKPGKKYTAQWEMDLYAGYRSHLRLKKVMFEDGSTWQTSQDTTPQTCEWHSER